MAKTGPALILGLLVAVSADAASPRKQAVLRRILTPEERAEFARPLLKVVAEVEAALGRAAGLRCSPASRPGDGLDTTTGHIKTLFTSRSMAGGSVPRLSATVSCVLRDDGGAREPIEVRLRVSANAQDRVNVLRTPDGDVVAQSSDVSMVAVLNYPFGLAARVGASADATVDAGTTEPGHASLLVELGTGAVPFAAAITSEFSRTELLAAIHAIRPTPPSLEPEPEPEVAIRVSDEERADLEAEVVRALFSHVLGSQPPIVKEPIGGLELAEPAEYRALAPELRASLFDDFEKRRKSPVLPRLPAGARFVPEKKLRKVLKGPGDWEKFHKAYPGGARVTTISPVAISADGTQAMMYLGWMGGQLFGQGSTFILVRTGGIWRVVYEIGHWIS